MAVSMAVMRYREPRAFVGEIPRCLFAGHSLGEYSALCAAGVFSIADTAKLLKTRGQAMQQAVSVGQGAMAAILGLDLETVLRAVNDAEQGEVCGVANDDVPGQVVISGHAGAVARAIELLKAAGAKRALPLPVSAPFHCALMRPAADAMEHALSVVTMNAPVVPVVVNVTARPTSDTTAIQKHLVEQVTGMVRWTKRTSAGWRVKAASRSSTNSAPARCSPASPSALPPKPRPQPSTPPISTRSSRRSADRSLHRSR